MQTNHLAVFVKAPRPGLVKTRLAATMGAEAACAAYCRLVETLVAKLAPLDAVEIRFTPDGAEAELQRWLQPGWKLAPQGPGDLGVKLRRAFASARAAGAERIVAIGSDCPEVAVADIESAWQALASHDVVLGPAGDGGYWLIGLKEPQPGLFEGIAWSTNAVFEQTVRRCHAAGLSVHRLRQLDDVDTEEDWGRFLAKRAGERAGGSP